MPKIMWDTVSILASMLMLIGGVGGLAGTVFLSALVWPVTPWLLALTIPVGLVVTSLVVAGMGQLLNLAIERSDR